jgi:hypothetical protein
MNSIKAGEIIRLSKEAYESYDYWYVKALRDFDPQVVGQEWIAMYPKRGACYSASLEEFYQYLQDEGYIEAYDINPEHSLHIGAYSTISTDFRTDGGCQRRA